MIERQKATLVKGKGDCCEQTDIAVTKDDGAYIVNAANAGEIPMSVMRQAFKNAQDSARKFCPFFDESASLCSIYNQRPLACMVFGYGAIPKDISLILVEDSDRKLSASEVFGPEMCMDCLNCLGDIGYEFLLQDISDVGRVNLHVGLNPTAPITDFVRKIFE